MQQTTSAPVSSRLDYIDLAKGLGMLAVIWGHTMQVGLSNSFVYAFHIPLFFFLSGLVYKAEKYDRLTKLLQSKWHALIKPYLVYSLVAWVAWSVYHLAAGKDFDYLYYFYEIFIAQGSGGFLLLYPLWFVSCLLVVEIGYNVLYKLCGRWSLLVSIVLASPMIWLLRHNDQFAFDFTLLPWSLESAFLALPFYALGHLFSVQGMKSRLHESVHRSPYASAVVALLGTLLVVVCAWWQGKVSMGHSDIGDIPLRFYLGGVVGTLTTIVVAILLERQTRYGLVRMVRYIGQQSYHIMAVHVPEKCAIHALVALAMGISVSAASEDLLASSITIFVTVPLLAGLVYIVRKKFGRRP